MPKVDPYKAPLPLLPTRLELPLRTRIIALSIQKSSIPVQNHLGYETLHLGGYLGQKGKQRDQIRFPELARKFLAKDPKGN